MLCLFRSKYVIRLFSTSFAAFCNPTIDNRTHRTEYIKKLEKKHEKYVKLQQQMMNRIHYQPHLATQQQSLDNYNQLNKKSIQVLRTLQKEKRKLKKQKKMDQEDIIEKEILVKLEKEKEQEQEQEQQQQMELELDDHEYMFQYSFKDQRIGELHIPTNMEIKNLKLEGVDSECLMLGVQKFNTYHNKFLDELLRSLDYDCVVTQIQPDLPYFIKNSSNFRRTWQQFVHGQKQAKFLVSSNPFYLQDITMSFQKVQYFIDSMVQMNFDIFEIGPSFIYTLNKSAKRKQANCLFQPLLSVYNNNIAKPVVICDIPILKYIDYLARTVDTKMLVRMLKDKFRQDELMNYYYDPFVVHKDTFIKVKTKYITEVIKQTMKVNKKVVVVLETEGLTQFVEDEWANIGSSQKPHLLNQFMEVDHNKVDQITFLNYVENVFLIDSLSNQFIYDNFIKFDSFPFMGHNTIGEEIQRPNVFIIWEQITKKYRKMLGMEQVIDYDLINRTKSKS